MRTIAITGATGFIGGKLVNYFAEKDSVKVLAFGRKPAAQFKPGVKYVRWDITEGRFPLDEAVDTVIHCAGSVSDWGVYGDMYRVNVEGTRNVLQTFAKTGQFIHLSTASVYDPFRPKVGVQETAPYPSKYLNSYGETKKLAELEVKASPNKNRVIVRPHIVYGPGDTTIYPRLMQARKFGQFMVIGKGENHLSLTYIDNLCQAIELITQQEFDLEIFNIADEYTDTLNNILAQFQEVLELKEPLLHLNYNLALIAGTLLESGYKLFNLPTAPLLSRYIITQMSSTYTLDISKAQEKLGYQPAYTYKEGFAALKHWLTR